MPTLLRKYSFLPLIFITIFLVIRMFFLPVRNWGGDIAEYFGISQSLMNHFSPMLTETDRLELERIIEPVNFSNPQYYIENRNGERWPVHFFFYSALLVPFRMILGIFGMSGFLSFRLLNFLVLFSAVFLIMKNHLQGVLPRYVYFVLVIFSPLMSFILWPGPDLFVISLLMLSVFIFIRGDFLKSSVLSAVASWHSQPLSVITLGYLAAGILFHKRKNVINPVKYLLPAVILAVPYLYNYLVFGMFSPWPLISDGWTKIYGFGMQNIHVQKLFDQFFDLNMGLFFYYPVPFILGVIGLITEKNTRIKIWVSAVIILTALAFQTNPAFNYGTAGYGPTRHIIFAVPFLIFFSLKTLRKGIRFFAAILIFLVTQSYVFSFNGYMDPDLIKTLYHNPIAEYFLDKYPDLYNPTPEIFVDRTNNSDLLEPGGAVYEKNGLCRKAYFFGNEEEIVGRCGFIPEGEYIYDRWGGYYINY